jgi:acetyl esterase/lipase
VQRVARREHLDVSRTPISPSTPTPANVRPAGPYAGSSVVRLTPLLVTSLLAVGGGAATYVAAVPAVWHLCWPFGLLFAGLGAAQLVLAVAVLVRPVRRRVLLAAATVVIVLGSWTVTRVVDLAPGPDPWAPLDSVIGFTDLICAVLEGIALVGLSVVAARGASLPRSRAREVLASAALLPVMVVVLLGAGLGVAGASDGLSRAGLPPVTVRPVSLPAGERSTVEYCRPDGIPLSMDIYTPRVPASTGPAPVALYIHGGGMTFGDRNPVGLGATLAHHDGALFEPLRRQLNGHGLVVASIDYRLLPAARWPAQIEDARCAVRFLRAHASDLGIAPDRIGVWGSSAGGMLASLLGVTGAARPGRGQPARESSAVQAVVDMFGPTDLNDISDSPLFLRGIVQIGVGRSIEERRAMSPITHAGPTAPPFLILHGDQDDDVPLRHSTRFALRLRSYGVDTTLIVVHGAGHSLDTPGQQPSSAELTRRVTEFLTTTLAPSNPTKEAVG